MTNKERNDYFYVCALIEYIATLLYFTFFFKPLYLPSAPYSSKLCLPLHLSAQVFLAPCIILLLKAYFRCQIAKRVHNFVSFKIMYSFLTLIYAEKALPPETFPYP